MISKLQPRRSGRAILFALAAACIAGGAAAQPAPTSAGPPDPLLIEDLVAANRILADHGLLDGWGHVSVRHNRDPNRFLMSRGLSAELVTAKDILEFDLDSRPVDTHGLPMSALFTERYTLGDHPAALMRGHGAVITGPSLQRVVSRTIFLALNATLQAQAMSMGAPII